MPLPARVSFDGPDVPKQFQVEGNSSFGSKILGPHDRYVQSPHGKTFLCLDKPVRGGRGARPKAEADRAYHFESRRFDRPHCHANTMAADGARLVCPDVQLKRGQVLGFSWMFMCWSANVTWNDFAFFEAIPDQGPSGAAHFQMLAEYQQLRSVRIKLTPWSSYAWHVEKDFSGSLIWAVANGQVIKDRVMTKPQAAAFTYPAVLLIEEINVS